jgi:predicted transcriptional regulator
MNILLSIKPEYTQKIFSGEKKYEFRRQRPISTIKKALIYECAPTKNIVGWFTVKRILSGSPKDIWEKCKNSGGIEREKYYAYCNGKKIIYALEIDSFFQFKNPINPFEFCSDFRPPQNFSYLDGSSICDWTHAGLSFCSQLFASKNRGESQNNRTLEEYL